MIESQVLLQTLVLGAMGAAAYFLRDLPLLALRWLSRFFLTSLEVDSRDTFLFQSLAEHLELGAGVARNSNQLAAHSRRRGADYENFQTELAIGNSPQVFVVPATGLHIFRLKGKRIFFRRELELGHIVFERMTLYCVGRHPQLLQDFLRAAVENRLERETRSRSIFIPDSYNSGEWRRSQSFLKRPFGSVVLREGVAESILADIRRFVTQREEYHRIGVPWRRSFLLYGPPGTGKTSLVSALASELGFNICTFSLASPFLTDEKIHGLLAAVPLNSILLVEDLDAFFTKRKAAHEGVKLSFSGFLNALDGVATQEGMIIFMTTNHFEKLDPALVRSGRVDRKVEFPLCDHSQLVRLFMKFEADRSKAESFARKHVRLKISPADVQEILLERMVLGDQPAGSAVEPDRLKQAASN